MIMCYLYQTVRHVIMLALLTLVSVSKTEQLVMLIEAAVYIYIYICETNRIYLCFSVHCEMLSV